MRYHLLNNVWDWTTGTLENSLDQCKKEQGYIFGCYVGYYGGPA